MKKEVLLVDDEVLHNKINEMLLEKSPLVGNVASVTTGKDALSLLEARFYGRKPFPEVILLDINMPMMNGFQFLEKLHDHGIIDPAELHIVMLSSSFDPRDKQRALELGIEDYSEKPLKPEHIRKYLEIRDPAIAS